MRLEHNALVFKNGIIKTLPYFFYINFQKDLGGLLYEHLLGHGSIKIHI